MSLLIPISLELEGFRSFKGRSIVTFPSSGAVLVNGKYVDNTTSSGSGKSSLLMAISYALGFCDLPTTELKNWHSKGLYVKLILSDGQNKYEIIRDPSLSLIINGNQYTGTSKTAEDQLIDILKTSPELTKTLTYRPQREHGRFVNSTDSENKEFLSSLLGLNEIEAINDIFEKESSSYKTILDNSTNNINYIKQSISALVVSDDDFEKAKKAYEVAQVRVNTLTNNNKETEKISQEISNVDIELNKINRIQREVQSATMQNQSIRVQIENLNKELADLKQNICPMCRREWDNVQNIIDQKNNKIKDLLESAKSNITVINNSKSLLNPAYLKMLNDKRSTLLSSLGQLKAPLQDAIRSKQSAEATFTALSKNRNKIKELEADIRSKEEEGQRAEIELYFSDHCAKLTNRSGFLGVIFDEVLRDINARANDLMKNIPNINTFTLNISSNSITKAGKINKKIEISVYKDGKKISLKSLSGGQKTSIELCTDLAVAETIRSRSGSNLGWVALDESMDGLDTETKLTVLDAIKPRIKGLIIIVDHSSEIKESFDKVIEVEFNGRESYVK